MAYAAFRHNGKLWYTHDKEHIIDRILKGKFFFFPGEKSVIITEIWASPTGLKTQNNFCAGGNKNEIKKMMLEVEKWGKEQGCHRQIGLGRRGWLRVFENYYEIGVRKEKSLI